MSDFHRQSEFEIIVNISPILIINLFFLTLISYTVSMVHLSSHFMFPIKYAFLYKTRRQ
jgi:hypothetical protein